MTTEAVVGLAAFTVQTFALVGGWIYTQGKQAEQRQRDNAVLLDLSGNVGELARELGKIDGRLLVVEDFKRRTDVPARGAA